MKVLVATTKGQTGKKTDYCWANEGEIIHFPSGGNRTCMVGLDTAKATTTMEVVELDLDHKGLIAKIATFLTRNWGLPSDVAAKEGEEEAMQLEELANFFDVGTIVERRGNSFRART